METSIRSSINGTVAGTVIVLHLLVLAALPALLPQSPVWALLVLSLAVMGIHQWGLIHEAIHKLLLPNTEANDRLGRLLGILLGASFHVLRFGHLMHHKLNRDWHSERVKQRTPGAWVWYYFNLFFGLYMGEIVTSLMFTFLPHKQFMRIARATFLNGYEEVAIAGERFFYQRNHVKFVRRDMLLSIAIYALAFWAYGAYWPLLAAMLLGRGVLISFLDNIYHYATPADNSKAGKELALPELASLALMRSNYHETHHLNPDVPWHCLPQTHAQQQRSFDGVWLTHARLQLAGPVL